MTIGDTVSTGGSDAHGDFTAVGTGLFATSEGFSCPVFGTNPVCLSFAARPGFRMVFGVLLSPALFSAVKFGFTATAGLICVFGSCAGIGTVSAASSVDLVPSIHTTVSGTQSSSSSSMSAHFDSLPFSSDCRRVAR